MLSIVNDPDLLNLIPKILSSFIQWKKCKINYLIRIIMNIDKSNRKATNRNRSNQKANPALKTKAGNK